MTTITEAKDKVAQNYGFSVWEFGENAMLTHISNEVLISDRFEQAAELYAEAKAKEFAEWVNENYTLVTSEELQKSAWVNLKRSVYVNGSDFHYTQMINEFGETIEQLYKNYNQNG